MERKGYICATCSLSRPAFTGLGARGRLLLLRLLRLLLRLQRRDGAALASPQYRRLCCCRASCFGCSDEAPLPSRRSDDPPPLHGSDEAARPCPSRSPPPPPPPVPRDSDSDAT